MRAHNRFRLAGLRAATHHARYRGPAWLALGLSATLVACGGGHGSSSSSSSSSTATGTLSLFAGNIALFGSLDGNAVSAARFNEPGAVVADANGNLYVADAANSVIRLYNTGTGVVSTLAGSAGSPGSSDGNGSNARFSQPQGIAIDSSNSNANQTVLYVADTGNNTVRKLVVTLGSSVSTNVTTLAGNAGTAGHVNASGSAAQFDQPFGVALDNAGNVYVADTGNSLIRKLVISSGAVSDFAGTITTTTSGSTTTVTQDPGFVNGAPQTGELSAPQGLAWYNGTLYVADTGNSAIRAVDGSGNITTLAGGGTTGAPGNADGAGSAAGFDSPNGITVDGSGNLYVADTGNDLIRKVDGSGNVTTYAGELNPAVTAYYITTTVQVITTNTTTNTSSTTSSSSTSTVYAYPNPTSTTTSTTTGNIKTTTNTTITVNYSYTTPASADPGSADGYALAGNGGSVAAFHSPRGVALVSGVLYVADGENDDLRQISAATPAVVRTVAGWPAIPGYADGSGAEALMYNPAGLAWYQDPTTSGVSYLFEADSGNNTVRVVKRTQNTSGTLLSQTVSTIAGSSGVSGWADGTGSAAQFNMPIGVALDPTGSSTGGPILYVSDANNDVIRSLVPTSSDLTAAWQSHTVAGDTATLGGSSSTAVSGTNDGDGTAAQFNYPNGLTVFNHKVYVADTNNNNIRQITPDGGGAFTGTVVTIAGSRSGASGSTVGANTSATSSARFFYPIGIAADGNGVLYLTEYGNHTVRQLTYNSTVGVWLASAVAGIAQTASAVDGVGSVATFSHPIGIAVANSSSGAAHYLYVADNFNYTIRKIDVSNSNDTVSTVVGVAGSQGFVPGSTPGAIYAPVGLAINPTTAGSAWDLYISAGDGIIKVANVP